MKKIETFKNHEEYFYSSSRGNYMTTTWAKDKAEAFINRTDVEVLSIHYAGGKDDAIMIIYKEIK